MEKKTLSKQEGHNTSMDSVECRWKTAGGATAPEEQENLKLRLVETQDARAGKEKDGNNPDRSSQE